MLKWISKSGIFIQAIVYSAIVALLWIPAFANPVTVSISTVDGPVFSAFAGLLMPFPGISVSLALALVVLQSILVFFVFQINGFFGRQNFLPAIILVIAYSWNDGYQTLHALLPANLFMLFALYSIMKMYGRQAAFHQVFSASFSIGIASLFYAPMVYMLLLVWISFLTYRVSTWREYAVSIIGFALPFVYFLSWLFWEDRLLQGCKQFVETLFVLPHFSNLPVIQSVWFSLSGIFLMVAMLAVLNMMGDKLISLRRRAWVLFNFGFCGLIAVMMGGCQIVPANYIFVIPLSFFITGSLSLLKRPLWAELMAISAILLLIFIRVYPLI